VLVALVGLAGLIARKFGVQFDDASWNEIVDAVLLVLTTGAALWAGWARATKPTPPLTQKAADATVEAAKKEGGYARPAALGFLFLVALTVVGLAGCTGTRDAYRSAGKDPAKVAFVVAEHYSAVVKEAADLKNSGALTGSALEAVRKADDAVRPVVLGDPVTHRPGLRALARAYEDVKSAKNAADLEAAIDEAVAKLTDLINALKRR
jgi:hypothetical protein